MNKYGQNMEDFKGRLNMSIFSNVEKSKSEGEIRQEFGEDCILLEKSAIDTFILDVYKNTGGEICKGKFNDTPEVNAVFEKAKEDIAGLTRVLFKDQDNSEREVFIMKAKESTQSFEKGKENCVLGEKLEKGHITSAFNYSSLLKFEKTGAEIKVKANAGKVSCEESVNAIAAEIAVFLAGRQGDLELPSEKPYLYGASEKINCPYLKFHYCLTDFWEGRDLNSATVLSNGKQCYPSSSHDDAKIFRDYNTLVEKWIDAKQEVMLLDLFINNFEDNKKYELNAEQMIALSF